MKNKAFVIGLAVLLYTFLIRDLALNLVFFLPSMVLITLVSLAASAVVAYKIAPKIAGDMEPPALISNLLLASAGFWLVVDLWNHFLRFGGVYLDRASNWALAATLALSVRFLPKRGMLFVGVTAFVMQFYLIGLAAGFLSQLAHWVAFVFLLVVAMLIAGKLTLREDSAANHVSRIEALWFFGAAGALTQFIDDRSLYFFSHSYAEVLVWLAFLVSFGGLIVNLNSRDDDAGEDNLATRMLVFIGLFLTITTVFHMTEVITDRIPLFDPPPWMNWMPLAWGLGLTAGFMAWTKLGRSLPKGGPGRALLLWGSILFCLAILAGGSILGSHSGSQITLPFLPTIVAFVIVAAPLMLVAQLLVGLGLLRMVFHARTAPTTSH